MGNTTITYKRKLRNRVTDISFFVCPAILILSAIYLLILQYTGGVIISQDVKQLQKVSTGEDVLIRYRLRNISLFKVTYAVFPSCGCTTANRLKADISPLASSNCDITIHTQRLKTGTHSKDVTFVFKATSGDQWSSPRSINFVILS